ncbi:MAG: hypothetical protein WCC27_15155, partial [Acidobacteriaceae bacterium]
SGDWCDGQYAGSAACQHTDATSCAYARTSGQLAGSDTGDRSVSRSQDSRDSAGINANACATARRGNRA